MIASVWVNFAHYLSEKKPDAFKKLVFPKIYGVPVDEAAENGLVEDNKDLETGKDLIDVVNEWAKTRGRFQKGSNKNPVSKTGPGDKKKQAETPDEKAAGAAADSKEESENNEEAEDKK